MREELNASPAEVERVMREELGASPTEVERLKLELGILPDPPSDET